MQCCRRQFYTFHCLRPNPIRRRSFTNFCLARRIVFGNSGLPSTRSYSAHVPLNVKNPIFEPNRKRNRNATPSKQIGNTPNRLHLDRSTQSTVASKLQHETLATIRNASTTHEYFSIPCTPLEELITRNLWTGQEDSAFEACQHAYGLPRKEDLLPSNWSQHGTQVSKTVSDFSPALMLQLAAYALLVEGGPRLAQVFLSVLETPRCLTSALPIDSPSDKVNGGKDTSFRASHSGMKLDEMGGAQVVYMCLHCACKLACLFESYGSRTQGSAKQNARDHQGTDSPSNPLVHSSTGSGAANARPPPHPNEVLYKQTLTESCAALESLSRRILLEVEPFQRLSEITGWDLFVSPTASIAFAGTLPSITASIGIHSKCSGCVFLISLLVQSIFNVVAKTTKGKKSTSNQFNDRNEEQLGSLIRQLTQAYVPQSYNPDEWALLVEGVLLPTAAIVSSTIATLECTALQKGMGNEYSIAPASSSGLIKMAENAALASRRWYARLHEALSEYAFSKPSLSPLRQLPGVLRLVSDVIKSWPTNSSLASSKHAPPTDKSDAAEAGGKILMFPVVDWEKSWVRTKCDRLRLYQLFVHFLQPFTIPYAALASRPLFQPFAPASTAGLYPPTTPSADRRQAGLRKAQANGSEPPPATKPDLHNKCNSAARLERVQQHPTDPPQVSPKLLPTSRAGSPDAGVLWVKALSVWQKATVASSQLCRDAHKKGKPRARKHFGLHETGRLMALLARAQRWREALMVYETLDYTQLDAYVFRQVAYALCSTRRRDLNSLVMELWADWRCKVGDEAQPTAAMVEQLLVAGLHGTDEAAACACRLVKEGVLQMQRPRHDGVEGWEDDKIVEPGSDPLQHSTDSRRRAASGIIRGAEVPLDLDSHIAVVERLLTHRWSVESWQSALAVAIASKRLGLIESVARKSPPRSAIFDAVMTSSSLSSEAVLSNPESERSENNTTNSYEPSEARIMAARMALASHAAVGKWMTSTRTNESSSAAASTVHSSARLSPRSRLDAPHHEKQLIEHVLDELLGRDTEQDRKGPTR